MGGKPCIRGLRVTVGTVVGLVAVGRSHEEILKLYPYLEEDDIREALSYAHLGSMELDPEQGATAAWEEEIAQRVARFKAGESKPIPAEDVYARLRTIAPNR